MKKLIGLFVLLLLGIYIVWPAWSGYRIASALSSGDEGLLAGYVDFPSVRESLKPLATAEIEKSLGRSAESLGPLAQVLGGNLKSQMSGQIVGHVLDVVVTPRVVIQIANERSNLAAALERAISEAAGQQPLAQIVGQKTDATSIDHTGAAASTTAPKQMFGLGNIKGFHLAGPLAFDVDVARDATQTKSDVTVGMAFTRGGWKLARVVPYL